VLGVKTNIGFLRRVMADEEFRKCKIDTGYIERHPELINPGTRDMKPALIAAAIAMNNSTGSGLQAQAAAASNWKLFARRSGVTRSPLA
jgi:pyruvate carboxylase